MKRERQLGAHRLSLWNHRGICAILILLGFVLSVSQPALAVLTHDLHILPGHPKYIEDSDVWGVGETINYLACCWSCYETGHDVAFTDRQGLTTIADNPADGEDADSMEKIQGQKDAVGTWDTLEAECITPDPDVEGTRTFYTVEVVDVDVEDGATYYDGVHYCAKGSGAVTVAANMECPTGIDEDDFRHDFIYWKRIRSRTTMISYTTTFPSRPLARTSSKPGQAAWKATFRVRA